MHGFGGMRDHSGISFDPRLPDSWSALTFRLTVRDSRMRVTVRPTEMDLVLEVGPAVTVDVRGQQVEVGDSPVTVALDGQGARFTGEPDATALRGTLRADGTVITASVPHHSGVNR